MFEQASKIQDNGTLVVPAISHYVCRTLVNFQHQHPNWINSRYRHIPWQQSEYQSSLIRQLNQGLSQARHQEALFVKLKAYLNRLFSVEFLRSPEYKSLIVKLEQLTDPDLALLFADYSLVNQSPSHGLFNGRSPSEVGISILLLDVENLPLDLETEKFLETICLYPVQIKVAFANWRSMGKKDLEYHQRGYQLIHVPPGKDSADLKMSTVGSSIFVHYPTAKEVLVCSSDLGLTHLCNTLQNHGLTVYQVSKNRSKITVLNTRTGQINTYSLTPIPPIPTLDQFIVQLQEIIKLEQKRSHCQWIKLNRVAFLYKDTYHLTVSQVVASHFSDYQGRDIFVKNPHIFVVHQPSEKSPSYVTLFEIQPSSTQPHALPETEFSQLPVIESLEDLENALIEIMQELTLNSSENHVSLSILGSQFNRKYGVPITQIIKKLRLGGNFQKLLTLSNSFNLEKTDKDWKVKLQSP
ncbi:PIN domain-containing protein [Planktothrix mougeotii]|uniref:NYN domain-containing protein n=1 Tax=Planktothrix mougeotii LEGE 06226 TaxID=1828728 RepID=A0ABR9UGR0_9CYAN|nr:hypothetical protein [Planktothrix mougeotii]MBE9145006.1 hypothetical protein [Planktothrix mougeotii LEGE 06226]